MATYHGKNAYFTIEDSGGTARDISSDLTSVSLPRNVPTAETTGFGATDQSHLAGVKGATMTLEGNWSDTSNTGTDVVLNGIIGDLKEFVYGPSGSTAGRCKRTGSAILTDYTVTSPVGGKVSFTATFIVSGAIAASTF